MNLKLLVALGIPTAYLVVTTTLLMRGALTLPPFLQRLSTRRAIAWNTMVGIAIALGALQWAFSR